MILLLSIFLLYPHKYEITCAEKSVVVEAERVELQDYIPLSSIAELIDLNYVLNNRTQRLTLTGGGHKAVLIANINIMGFDQNYENLPFGPVYINHDIYFPLGEVIDIIGSRFDRLIFIKEIKEVPLIEKITTFTRGDTTGLKFTWSKPIGYDVQFSLKNTVIEIDGKYQKKKLKKRGAITRIKLIPYNTYTRIELSLKGVNSYIQRDDEVLFYQRKRTKIKLIVIDPGHGGIDPGAVGRTGLYEKDANLSIARYLRNYIRDSLKIKVIMTRNRDVYLSLKQRTNIANHHGADLFLSIHCNSTKKKRAQKRGIETYFLSEARTNEERAVAARENASLKFDGIKPTDEVSFILYDLAQSSFLEESNRFAEYIQESAEKLLNIPSRGVKQAGFYVLRGAFMPAVLVECAFISNPREERLLRKKSFRKKVAYCIYRGIKNYIEDYERRLNN